MVRILKEEDVNNLIIGATILGTGGGGDPKEGLRTLMDDINSGRKLELAEASELDPESLVICAYFCGSIAAPEEKEKRLVFNERCMMKGLRIMEKRLGRRISAIIPTEIGGGNTAVALHLASILGVPTLDGDQVGRSAPELNQSSYIIHGIKAVPSIILDPCGNIVVVEDYVDVSSYESIARSLAVAFGGFVLVMDSPVAVKEAERVAVNNTVSRAINLGEAIMKAKEYGKNPVEAAVDFLDGFKVFSGFIMNHSLKVKQGFLVGEVEIKGTDEWKGSIFRIWVKNENIIGWKDGKVAVMPPDLICLIDENGYGITNSEVKIGMKVNVIGARAPEIWRTEKGLELFGPRHFGFDYDYIPIENLLKEI